MIKKIKMKCPLYTILFFNIYEYNSIENKLYYKAISQPINECINITIEENTRKAQDLIIKTEGNNNILPLTIRKEDEEYNNIYKTVEEALTIFYKYTGIKYNELTIKLETNYSINYKEGIVDLLDPDKILKIALIRELNEFYRNEQDTPPLSKTKLKDISLEISPLGPLYLSDSSCLYNSKTNKLEKIDSPYTFFTLLKLPDVQFNKDTLFEKCKERSLVEILKIDNYIHLYNDINHLLPEELKKLRKLLLEYKNIEHTLSGLSPVYLIANKERTANFEITSKLKENFSKIKIRRYDKFDGFHTQKQTK